MSVNNLHAPASSDTVASRGLAAQAQIPWPLHWAECVLVSPRVFLHIRTYPSPPGDSSFGGDGLSGLGFMVVKCTPKELQLVTLHGREGQE